MKEEFEKFIRLVEKSITFDPWVKDAGMEGFCTEIVKEAEEVREAVEKKDYENLKEELGDILYDWAHACRLGEERGLFSLKEVIISAEDKLKRRKPYVLEDKHVSKQESLDIWFNAKAKEKEKNAKR